MKSLSPTPLAKDLSLRGQDLDKQRLYNKVVASPTIERVGNSLIVKMHGVRGSIPQPKNTSKYGGNTSCYELVTDDFQIILDTGTGFQDVILDRQKTTQNDCGSSRWLCANCKSIPRRQRTCASMGERYNRRRWNKSSRCRG